MSGKIRLINIIRTFSGFGVLCRLLLTEPNNKSVGDAVSGFRYKQEFKPLFSCLNPFFPKISPPAFYFTRCFNYGF